MFDTDRSGAISLREFTKRDGLREALLAQLGDPPVAAAPHPAAAVPSGYRPGQPPSGPRPAAGAAMGGYRPGMPVAAVPAASRPSGPRPPAGAPAASSAHAELQEMLPHESPARIKEALSRCRGDKAAAAEWLLRQGGAGGGGSPAVGGPVVQGILVDDGAAGPWPLHMPGATGLRPGEVRPAPPSKGVPKLTGRRRAVMVGINYFGTQAQLRGCINDVRNMRALLTETFRWPPNCIRTLTDDDPSAMPTRANIEAALRWLVAGAQPGDILFFHFSGHGAQQEDPHGYEEDGMNETILPVDFKAAGMMPDDQLGDIIVKGLPEGVRLTAIMDCCHSGTGLDLPYTWMHGRGWKEETNPFHSMGDVQMISGCEDDDTSSDASTVYGAAGGAMTTAFCDVMRAKRCLSYPDLMQQLNHVMRSRGFSQHAQLTSSQRFDFNRPFLLDDIIPNGNPTVGRTFRHRFPPRPRPMQGPLADMLGIGVAVVGGMMMAEMAGGVLGALFG